LRADDKHKSLEFDVGCDERWKCIHFHWRSSKAYKGKEASDTFNYKRRTLNTTASMVSCLS
jgi:hypothetical protein